MNEFLLGFTMEFPVTMITHRKNQLPQKIVSFSTIKLSNDTRMKKINKNIHKELNTHEDSNLINCLPFLHFHIHSFKELVLKIIT